MEAGTKEILIESKVVRLQEKIALKSFDIFVLCWENRSLAVKRMEEAIFDANYFCYTFF